MTEKPDSGSLLVGIWPPEFEPCGRRVLAWCEEMTLYEMYRFGGEQKIELAPDVEQALQRSLHRINDTFDTDSFERTDRDRRMALALELKRLRHSTMTSGGNLRELIDWALAEPDVERAIRSAGNVFCTALRAIAREEGKIADQRTTKRLPTVAALILEARELFVYLREKPPRNLLIRSMETQGYCQSGNDALGKWREIFRRAELNRWW